MPVVTCRYRGSYWGPRWFEAELPDGSVVRRRLWSPLDSTARVHASTSRADTGRGSLAQEPSTDQVQKMLAAHPAILPTVHPRFRLMPIL